MRDPKASTESGNWFAALALYLCKSRHGNLHLEKNGNAEDAICEDCFKTVFILRDRFIETLQWGVNFGLDIAETDRSVVYDLPDEQIGELFDGMMSILAATALNSGDDMTKINDLLGEVK